MESYLLESECAGTYFSTSETQHGVWGGTLD